MMDLGRKFGLNGAAIASKAKDVTGKDSGWTHPEVDQVAMQLGAK